MRFSLLAAAVGLCSLVAPLAARADLVGDTINVSYRFPTQGATFADLGSYVVPGSGGVTGTVTGNPATFTISGNQISLNASGNVTIYSAPFSGLEFDDTNPNQMITGATLDSSSNLAGAIVSFTGTSVAINFANLADIPAGASEVIDLTFGSPAGSSVTPEPTSIALLGTGMLGLGGVLRRRVVRA